MTAPRRHPRESGDPADDAAPGGPRRVAHGGGFTLLLGALIGLSPFAMDVYLASMPSMADALATDATRVQLTLSVYMYVLGVAQLFAGPVSDRYGRRRTLIAATALAVAASIACALAPSVELLIAARALQAIAVAACSAVPRALVRDLYSGNEAARMLSLMGVVLGVSPLVAPMVGALLHDAWGWRSTFAFLALYAAVALAAIHRGLPETLHAADHRALAPRAMLGNFARLLRSRSYVGYFLVAAFMFCGLFAFIAGSAYVFVSVMDAGEKGFGLLFGAAMLGNITGASIGSRVVRRLGIDRVIRFATAQAALAATVMAALAWLGVQHPAAVVVPMFFFMASLMMVLPQAMAGGMTPFPEIAGAAASLQAFGQFVFASTAALVVGLSFDHTTRPMTTAIAVSALLAFAASRMLVARPRDPASETRG